MTINTKDKANSKKTTILKNGIKTLSGADISTLIFWTPIFQKINLQDKSHL